MTPTTRAVGYVRVSTEEQIKGESLSTQRKQIEEFCESKKWGLIKTYDDEGRTGASLDARPGFRQMIEDAKNGQFDVIVIWKLSRFARNARDYQNTTYELEQHGVLVASVKESIDPTTKTGKMIGGMIALFAEWEHETIREQMSENKMAKWRDNRAFMGKAPFGYNWNKAEAKLEVHRQEKAIYDRIVKMYIRQGMSMRDITLKLNEEGLTPTMYRKKRDGNPYKQNPWTSTVVNYILSNPAYYGNYVMNQMKYALDIKTGKHQRTKERKPESEHINFKIDPLISKTEWDEIQSTMAFRRIKTKHKGEFTDLSFLRDVCVCGFCGGKINVRLGSLRKDGTRPRYYTCYWSGTSKKNLTSGRKHKCHLPHIKAEELEREVWNEVMIKFALDKKRLSRDLFDPAKYEKKTTHLRDIIARQHNDLLTKQRTRKGLYRLLEMEGADLNELHLKMQENRDHILTIEANLKESQDRLLEFEESAKRENEIKEFLENNKSYLRQLRNDIHELSLSDRKLLVESMLNEPIEVSYQEDSELDGPGGFNASYNLRYNPDIIQRFIDEGKIHQLRHNGR